MPSEMEKIKDGIDKKWIKKDKGGVMVEKRRRRLKEEKKRFIEKVKERL